ncbi:MAG: ATP-dependent DNA helicase RecG [Candidatus Magasanikbacteria bacterium]|nr:ATP-dependent DNA helicase RecG [Candidatus Magasanikbacteria bacterium]
MDFLTPVSKLTKVGKTTATRLKRLGIITAGDLLRYFPFRYEDFRRIVPIKDLREGESVTVAGSLELIANRRSFRNRKIVTEALVSDATGSLRVVWFNQPFLTKNLHPGDRAYLSGTVKNDMLGAQLVSPAYEKAKTSPSVPLPSGEGTVHTARLVPLYPLTGGLTQKQVRFLVQQILPLAKAIPEWLPSEVLETNDLVPLSDAIRGIHFPEDEADLKKSTERLKFDELFLIQLQAELNRQDRLSQQAPTLVFKETEIKSFVARLPFTLTKTQKIAAWEILQNIATPTPMNRLLSGDVGSGKTVVAAMALYNAVLNGYQGVLMAPTEILAAQHYASLTKLFAWLPVTVGLLTANQAATVIPTESARVEVSRCLDRQSLDPRVATVKGFLDSASASLEMTSVKNKKAGLVKNINSGSLQIVIGTHALLSENVQFKNLGLVIVDEQHRFGVEQRKQIKEKTLKAASDPSPSPLPRGEENVSPSPHGRGQGEGSKRAAHFLSMTATPIPRSLALMIYGDLDISIINELPPGRKKIITRLVEPAKREKAYEFIRAQVKEGRQVFVVCPLIESNGETKSPLEGGIAGGVSLLRVRSPQPIGDATVLHPHYPPRGGIAKSPDDKKSVLSEYEKLSKTIFSDLKVGFLHGKLKPSEKDETMEKFKKGEIDILVSTSVIEVGVDIPNASVMMIEGADRFGLAQLHQFRGRVGRSSHQSYCLLFTDSDSSRVNERLKYFEMHHDGFKLAEKDLEMRGPGEVYGAAFAPGYGEPRTEQSGMQQLRLAKLTDRDIIKKAREAARDLVATTDIYKYPKVLEKLQAWEQTIHLE